MIRLVLKAGRMEYREWLKNDFWFDSWLDIEPMKRSVLWGGLNKVEDSLLVGDLLSYHHWNLTLISFILPWNIINLIRAVPLSIIQHLKILLGIVT